MTKSTVDLLPRNDGVMLFRITIVPCDRCLGFVGFLWWYTQCKHRIFITRILYFNSWCKFYITVCLATGHGWPSRWSSRRSIGSAVILSPWYSAFAGFKASSLCKEYIPDPSVESHRSIRSQSFGAFTRKFTTNVSTPRCDVSVAFISPVVLASVFIAILQASSRNPLWSKHSTPQTHVV